MTKLNFNFSSESISNSFYERNDQKNRSMEKIKKKFQIKNPKPIIHSYVFQMPNENWSSS